VVGTIAALAVYLWARSEDSGLLLAIAYSGLFLNLFNLLPISPLDGGRVTAALSPRIWFLGVPILLALVLYRPSPMLIIVAILAAPQLMKAWRYDPQAPENDRLLWRSAADQARIWRRLSGAGGAACGHDIRCP
jgi:Zn-dependent protease